VEEVPATIAQRENKDDKGLARSYSVAVLDMITPRRPDADRSLINSGLSIANPTLTGGGVVQGYARFRLPSSTTASSASSSNTGSVQTTPRDVTAAVAKSLYARRSSGSGLGVTTPRNPLVPQRARSQTDVINQS